MSPAKVLRADSLVDLTKFSALKVCCQDITAVRSVCSRHEDGMFSSNKGAARHWGPLQLLDAHRQVELYGFTLMPNDVK